MNAIDNSVVGNSVTGERADLLESLRLQRYFLRYTVRDLTDEQAASRPTVSALCLGGLIKHVSDTEKQWGRFILTGPSAIGDWDESGRIEGSQDARRDAFSMVGDETLAGILAAYEKVAAKTDALVLSLANLDDGHRLPKAPWFEPGAVWSARRVLLHVIAETSQHAGHADILREAIDGSKTMS